MNYKYTDEKGEHMHTFDSKPLFGCSTVVGVLAKNLTWWAAEHAAVTALESGEHIPTIRSEYLEAKKLGKPGIDALQKKYPIFKKARFAHNEDKNKKAEQGTDMHAIMEEYVKKCIKENKGVPYPFHTPGEDKRLSDFIDHSVENFARFIWSEIHGYNEDLWVGGITDLGVELKNGEIGIIDFKSSKDTFDSQFIQCAGYDLLISKHGGFDADGNKIYELPKPLTFYGIIPFGAEIFKVDYRHNVDELKKGFESCVTLHKLTNH